MIAWGDVSSWVVAPTMATVGWVAARFYKLESRLNDHIEHDLENFVHKDDFRSLVESMDRKLDRLADRQDTILEQLTILKSHD